MSERKRVLFGFAEALPAPEVFFSLRDAGFECRVFCRAGERPLLTRSLPLGAPFEITAPEADAAQAAADLRRILAENAFDALLGLDDNALFVIDRAFADGAPEGLAIANPLGAPAAVALDKTRQIAAAREAGLDIPETIVAADRESLRAAEIPAPLIVKPAMAVTLRDGRFDKGRAHFFETAAELRAAADALDVLFPALIQPLIPGHGEGVFGFADERGVSAWSGHRRIRMMNPHGSGASACASVAPDPALKAAAAAMISAIGWRGPFMIELLRGEDGRAYFMELNGRLWGSLALARRSGFEYPAWAVRQALDPSFAPPEVAAKSGMTTRHLGRDLLHLLHVLRGPKSDFHKAGWPSFWRSLPAVLAPQQGKRFYNYDPAFPYFFLRDAMATVAHQVFGRR